MYQDWKKASVNGNVTIREALEVIDAVALRIALIIDENEHLLGTVTDGDVRRGLLKEATLESSVTEVMNSAPITANAEQNKQELISMMESKGILALPIIDEGRVVGLETLQSLMHVAKHDNPVFIMAGGFGTRLRPLTDNCPKPLLKVGEKPILETIIRNFIKCGFHNFYISTHYMPEMIMDYLGDGSNFDIKIEYVYEDKPLGTGGALGLLPDNLVNKPLVMINGDILTNMDFGKLLDFHNKEQAAATMCVREYNYQIPYGVIESSGHEIKSIVEKPVQYFHVNAGIYVVSPDVISSVKRNEHIDMPALLEEKMNNSNKVLMYPIHEYWLDIGRMEDFERAQKDIMSLEI
ncbi:nucleotidyltransferase family protein [Providencia hangzhouensis]